MQGIPLAAYVIKHQKGLNIMARRNPPGYGCVKEYKDGREKKFVPVVTVKYDYKKLRDITFLKEALDPELYAQVEKQCAEFIEKHPHGRQVQMALPGCKTRAEANIALAEYNKSPYDIDKKKTTFEQIYNILYEAKFSKMKKNSKSAYVASFNKCDSIKRMRMTEIRKYHLQAIVDEYAVKSPSTQKNIMVLFHAIYKHALENDIVEKDYSQFVTASSVQKTKKKVPFTREEVQKLWDNLDNNNYDFIDSYLIMIYAGMRNEELRMMKKEDVHLEERYIELRGTKTEAAERLVPIHKKIVPLLEKRLAGDSEYLFPSSWGNPISYSPYRIRFDKVMEDLKLYPHTPHECRHSFSTYAQASGLDRVYIKKIIGHKNQDLTADTYTHAFIEDLVKQIDKFEV